MIRFNSLTAILFLLHLLAWPNGLPQSLRLYWQIPKAAIIGLSTPVYLTSCDGLMAHMSRFDGTDEYLEQLKLDSELLHSMYEQGMLNANLMGAGS